MKHCFSLVSTKAENLFLFFIICILLSFFTSTFFLFLFISARSDSLKQSSGRRKRIFEKKQKADCCCCCCCCYFQTMMLQFRCQSTLILSFTVRLLCTPDIGKDKYFFLAVKRILKKMFALIGIGISSSKQWSKNNRLFVYSKSNFSPNMFFIKMKLIWLALKKSKANFDCRYCFFWRISMIEINKNEKICNMCL